MRCKPLSFRNTTVSAVILLTLAGVTIAEETAAQTHPIVPPGGGHDVLSFSPDQTIKFRSQNVEAAAEWISIEDMPFRHAYRVESDTRFSDPTNMQVNVPIEKPIRKGDVMLISFWLRRPEADGQPNYASFFVDAEPDSPGYEYQLMGYRVWQQHVRSFVAPNDFSSSQASVRMHLGQAGEIVEIADLRLVNYGRDRDISTLPKSTVTYRGRAEDAAWRKAARARIDKIRKGDLAIEVVDDKGRPIPHANVTVAMQRHAFGFGTAVNSEVLGADESDFPIQPKRKVIVTWQDAQKYRQIVKKYFDRVTFESELRPHVWKLQKSDNPGWNRKYQILMEKTLPWLRANNITARGHYIAWAPMDFNSIEKQFIGNPAGHRKWLWDHMADVLPQTADFVTEWDTINHIVGWGEHTYEKEYGGLDIYAEILAEARRLAPDATHAINEGKVLPDGYKREPYKRVIRFLNEQGQAPDIVGFMGHFGVTTLTPPEELLEVYDDFATIAPRLQLSEFDVEAGDDYELQADYYRDCMIATFSHPNFEAIIQWGFWGNMHWKPAAALWRDDWTLNPSGEVFLDLVANQWWTDEKLTTDSQGRCQLRGFLGDYQILVDKDGKSKKVSTKLDRNGGMVRIQIP